MVTCTDRMETVFEEDFGEQAAEALVRALKEAGVVQAFDLELRHWSLEAEIVWHTGQCPAWEVWEASAGFLVYAGEGAGPIVPSLEVEVHAGKVSFPNLERVVATLQQSTSRRPVSA